jgi:hypothetical protein
LSYFLTAWQRAVRERFFNSFVAQGHAVYAGTCGFVVSLSKKLRYMPLRVK